MSHADGADRFLAAATALGVAGGMSALTMQGIATEVGVSKALVLYHFDDKRALLRALALRIAAGDAAALRTASAAEDPFDAWLVLGADLDGARTRALLAALMLEPALRGLEPEIRGGRQQAATALATAMLAAAGLVPRVSGGLLGRVLLQQLDGIGATTDDRHGAVAPPRAALDAFALALLALGESTESTESTESAEAAEAAEA